MAFVEVVINDHVVAIANQLFADHTSDVPRAACYKHSHLYCSLFLPAGVPDHLLLD
jgi:hypothetical protein